MIAWHGEPELKASVLGQLKNHRNLDEIVQGSYWEGGRGCCLGCLTHVDADVHETTQRLFGIPLKVCYWMEAVFEGLDKGQCAEWVIDSAESIAVGADMTKAHHSLGYWILGSDLLTITDVNREAIAKVRRLHELSFSGTEVTTEQWSAAMMAAESAAWSARAWLSAAESAESESASAARSAESAAESAEWSARSAARSAESAARLSAESAWDLIAAKSLDIFQACPIAGGSRIDAVRDELCISGIYCDGEDASVLDEIEIEAS